MSIKVIGLDVLKVVEFPFTETAKFVEVLDTVIKDSPAVKAAVIGLVKQAELVIGDTVADVAEKGLNLSSDLNTLTAAESFFQYFAGTFLPAVEAAYKEIKADIVG